MLTVTQITPEELDELSARHGQGSFQQTSAMMALSKRLAQSYDVLGLRDGDGRVVGGCFVIYTKGRLGLEGSVWLGPMCDVDDSEALRVMTDGIARSARRHGAISVTCWPNLVYQMRDSSGMANAPAADDVLERYRSLGWRHAGFTLGYGSVVNRWVYVKDLTGIADEKALLNSYDKRTQWSIKRAQSMGVHVREFADDELGVFAQIERQTAERRNFAYRGDAYFHEFKRAFGSRARFMVAEIHVSEYAADMTAKRDALAAQVEVLKAKYEERPTTKLERQLGELTRNLAAAQKRLDEASSLAQHGEVIPAAVSLFVEHPQEMVYLFSGSVAEYKPFYASALIQHWALSRCLELGIARYNFYGISGVFDDPDDEGRGVLEFKQGFNGKVEELIGEFTLPVDKLRFGVKEFASKLLRR